MSDMRDESIGNEAISPASVQLASQASLYKNLAPDVEFPWNYLNDQSRSEGNQSVVVAIAAIHDQLVVNAQLLRALIELHVESGTTSHLVSIPPDGTLVTESSVFCSRLGDET